MRTREDTTNVSRKAGTRARTSQERPPRCEHPKIENGKPCKRNAGAGTAHPGVGPCANHDDGSWLRPPFAENAEARDAFLEAVTGRPHIGIRDLIEPLGYHRRDVQELLDADRAFTARYEQARGWDIDRLRTELHRRAFQGSDRLLEFAAKMRLPEAAVLRQSHVEGRVDVTVQHVLDVGRLTDVELAELKRLLTKASPQELERAQRPALELVSGE